MLDTAIALAAASPIYVLHFIAVLDPRAGLPAVPPDGPIEISYADRVREYMAAKVDDAFQSAGVPCAGEHFLHARIGGAATEILELAEEVGASIIFIGTHGYSGIKHLMLGSVAERVVREARCPVTVVRAKTYADVELERVVEIPAHKRPTSRLYRFSYTNSNVIMRPPEWPIH